MVAQRFRETPLQEPEGQDAAGHEQRREERAAAAALLAHHLYPLISMHRADLCAAFG